MNECDFAKDKEENMRFMMVLMGHCCMHLNKGMIRQAHDKMRAFHIFSRLSFFRGAFFLPCAIFDPFRKKIEV